LKSFRIVLIFVALTVGGVATGCGSGDANGSVAQSADSHTFKGKGEKELSYTKDSDVVVLSGHYTIHWEIKSNTIDSTVSPGEKQAFGFQLELVCSTKRDVGSVQDKFKIVDQDLSHGSGDKKISISKSQLCQVVTVAADEGKWTVSVER
jgi:hypothetical protein